MIEHYSIPKAKALRDLRILKASFKESERRGRKPNPEELWKFSHVAVLTEGYQGMPTTWHETDPESPAYPLAFQVRIQVEAVIAELEGKRPAGMPQGSKSFSFPPKDESGQVAKAALHQLLALRRSTAECGRLEVNLSPEELSQYKYVVVRLQMAGYDVDVLTWDDKDPQSVGYPLPFQILAHIDAAIKDVLGLSVETEPEETASESEPQAKHPGGKAGRFPKAERELKRQIDINDPNLSQARFKEYRRAILEIVFENKDPVSRKIILDHLERKAKLASFFAAVRRAISLVDEAKGPGAGRLAKEAELQHADAKNRDGTGKHRFGFAWRMLRMLDVPSDTQQD